MAKLVLHDSDGAQREIPLDQRRMVIGRRKEAEIHITDKTASSQHAAIVTIGDNCYLQDLKSTNGTLVNGAPVQKHTLRHGDEILIGRCRIRFVDEPTLDATLVVDRPVVAAAAPAAMELPPNLAGITGAAPAPTPTPTPPEAAAPASSSANTAASPSAAQRPATPPSTPAADTEYAPWASEDDKKDMVDSMIDAIRSHREWVNTERINRKLSIDEEWKKLVEAAQKLKLRLGNHPQLQFFDISRQQDEIMIRVRRASDRANQHAILLSRQHPTTPSPLETIWLIETGEPDRHFGSCERIMRSVLSSLGPMIA